MLGPARHHGRSLFRPVWPSYPRSRSGTGPPASVLRIRDPAFFERQASTSDALRQPLAEASQFRGALIDPLQPFARQPGPVTWRRHVVCGQFCEFLPDLVQRETNLLRENDEGDSSQH